MQKLMGGQNKEKKKNTRKQDTTSSFGVVRASNVN